jgi:Fe-S-cluster containining protein
MMNSSPNEDRFPPLPDSARSELERIYREADAEIAATGVRCDSSGVCCDFENVPHLLYASTVEISHVKELHPKSFEPGSKLCPFWIDRQCMSRERRPLGCRTYYCDERYRDVLEDIYEKYYRQIRQIAEKHGMDWSYVGFVDALRDTL